MEMISRYFSILETVRSETAENLGIGNIPDDITSKTLITCAEYMDGIREFLGKPVLVNSWYRSPPLCVAIGSKRTSQHTRGEAVDWSCPQYGSCEEIARALALRVRQFGIDQLILERGWIHTSFAITPPRVPRREVLTLLASGGYATGITDPYGKLIA